MGTASVYYTTCLPTLPTWCWGLVGLPTIIGMTGWKRCVDGWFIIIQGCCFRAQHAAVGLGSKWCLHNERQDSETSTVAEEHPAWPFSRALDNPTFSAQLLLLIEFSYKLNQTTLFQCGMLYDKITQYTVSATGYGFKEARQQKWNWRQRTEHGLTHIH